MAVVISNPRQDSVDGNFHLLADVTVAGKRKSLVFTRFGNAPRLFDAQPTLEPFAIMMLAPSMLAGEPLVIEGEIDPNLLFHMNGVIQDLLKAVVPKMSKVLVDATAQQVQRMPSGTIATRTAIDAADAPKNELAAATGFSGGIDSSYVLSRCFFKRDVPKSMHIGLLMHHNVGAFSSQQTISLLRLWHSDATRLVGVPCAVGACW